MNSGRLLASLLIALVAPSSALAGITIKGPTTHKPKSTCPAADGDNKLDPEKPTQVPPPAAGSTVMNTLGAGFPGWTFSTGASLSGTLTIDDYSSVFDGSHYSGCNMKAHYDRAAGDPANIQFIQMITTTVPASGATSPYIDPHPSDDPATNPLPFYYTLAEMPGQTSAAGISFSDKPRRKHPPTSSAKWKGTLYIASWDGSSKKATLHDGIEYGFKAGCAKATTTGVVAVGMAQASTVTGNDTVLVTLDFLFPITMDHLTSIAIPNDPALNGLHLYAQVCMFDSDDPNDPIKLSNGIDILIGGTSSTYGPASGVDAYLVEEALPGGAISIAALVTAYVAPEDPENTDGKEVEEEH